MPSWDVHFDLCVDVSDPALVAHVAAIRATARTIRGIPIPPAVQEDLHRLNIMRAVRGTTGLEGADLSEEEVREVIGAREGAPVLSASRQREEREVRNAHALMRFVEDRLRAEPGQPLTEGLIREFHRILTDGIVYPNGAPGRYRTGPVSVADYHAPDHASIPRLMAGFIAWLHEGEGRRLDPVVCAVVAHFLLVSIHPFGDGNGRTSRGVESFLLYRAGVNVRGFYSLANYYYQRRGAYVDMLTHVRFVSDPDATPFVRFALRGLESELEQVHGEIINEVRIIAFKDFAREQIEESGRLGRRTGGRQLAFLVELAGQDADVRERDLRSGAHRLARHHRGIGRKTLTRDLHALRELGLITIRDGYVGANLASMERFA